MTSPDGITWTSRTSAADNSWVSLSHGNNNIINANNTSAAFIYTFGNGLSAGNVNVSNGNLNYNLLVGKNSSIDRNCYSLLFGYSSFINGRGDHNLVFGNSLNLVSNDENNIVSNFNLLFGYSSILKGKFNLTFGESNTSYAKDCVVIGSQNSLYSAGTTDGSTISIGGIVLGNSNTVTHNGIAIGKYNSSLDNETMSLGYSSISNELNGIAIGNKAISSHTRSMAIGYSVNTTQNNQIIIGGGVDEDDQLDNITLKAKSITLDGDFNTNNTYDIEINHTKGIDNTYNFYISETSKGEKSVYSATLTQKRSGASWAANWAQLSGTPGHMIATSNYSYTFDSCYVYWDSKATSEFYYHLALSTDPDYEGHWINFVNDRDRYKFIFKIVLVKITKNIKNDITKNINDTKFYSFDKYIKTLRYTLKQDKDNGTNYNTHSIDMRNNDNTYQHTIEPLDCLVSLYYDVEPDHITSLVYTHNNLNRNTQSPNVFTIGGKDDHPSITTTIFKNELKLLHLTSDDDNEKHTILSI
jgi:hypothetical protein